MNITSLFKTSLMVGWVLGLSVHALQAQGSAYRITGVPSGETLNIRTGPGTNFSVTAELPNGKEGIAIAGDTVMNGSAEWVPITYPGGKGWVRSKYLARSSSGSGSSFSSASGSSSGMSSTASEPGRTIVRSDLHGLTLSVKLPADMNKMEVVTEAIVKEEGEEMGDMVFACFKSGSDGSVMLERLTEFSANQKLNAAELEDHDCLKWERASADLGSMKKFKGTFLGKPAFAVLVSYKAGFPESSRMMFSVITLEPVNGRFYKLSYALEQADAGYALSPQELISSVRLAESGESTTTSVGVRPMGSYSEDIQVFFPGEKAVVIPRTLIFRANEVPQMVSTESNNEGSLVTTRVSLDGSWVGNQYRSMTQRILSCNVPNSKWYNEEVVITVLSFDKLKLEASWPYKGQKVQLSGTLTRK